MSEAWISQVFDEAVQHARRIQFERYRYVLVRYQWDEDWRWMFIYPTVEAYEQGGEPQSYQFKYVTQAEYENYKALGLFEEVSHADIRAGRI